MCRKGRVLDDDAIIAELGLEQDDILIATIGKSCYKCVSTALLVLLSAFGVRGSIRQAETISATQPNDCPFFSDRYQFKHKPSYIYGLLTSPTRCR